MFFCDTGSSEHHRSVVDFPQITAAFSRKPRVSTNPDAGARGVGLCSRCGSPSPSPRLSAGSSFRNRGWIWPLSLSSFVQSCLSSQIVSPQSETPSEQLPLAITLPDSLDYQEENWSEHLPVLINCVAQVI